MCARLHAVVGTLATEFHCGDFCSRGFSLFYLNNFKVFLEVLILHFSEVFRIKLL